jgi:putative transposase
MSRCGSGATSSAHSSRSDSSAVDVYLQTRRNAEAAKRFVRRLLRSHGTSPRKIVTDRLGSYGVARRALMPGTIHSNDRHANNRADLSHQPTRARERGMRRFSSPEQAQHLLSPHAVVYSLFNLLSHLASAAWYRLRRARAFESWNKAVEG